MRIIILTIISIAGLFFVACTKKALPTIPERERMESSKDTSFSMVQPDAARGMAIFMNRCARCHDLPDPSQYSFERWEVILKTMAPKARLNEEQRVHVTTYIEQNAKK
jgi:hypothetical protein